MENLFKKYVEEICPNCTNQDCENGKGIHVFTHNGIVLLNAQIMLATVKLRNVDMF